MAKKLEIAKSEVAAKRPSRSDFVNSRSKFALDVQALGDTIAWLTDLRKWRPKEAGSREPYIVEGEASTLPREIQEQMAPELLDALKSFESSLRVGEFDYTHKAVSIIYQWIASSKQPGWPDGLESWAYKLKNEFSQRHWENFIQKLPDADFFPHWRENEDREGNPAVEIVPPAKPDPWVSLDSGPLTIQAGNTTGEIDPVQNANRLSRRIEELDVIAHEVSPPPPRSVTLGDIAVLRETLGSIQSDQAIRNKGAFVQTVNKLLKASNHRLKTFDGRLCLLQHCPMSRGDYIRLRTTGGYAGRLGLTPATVEPLPQGHRATRYSR